MTGIEFSVLAALLGLYVLFFTFLLVVACVRGARWQKKQAKSAELIPRISEGLINYLAGNNDIAFFREIVKSDRADFEIALMSLQSTAGGGARERLCSLALELTLIHEWCEDTRSRDLGKRRTAFDRLAFASYYEPCRRVAGEIVFRALQDDDREVALLAGRAVIHSEARGEIEQVFELAVREDLLARVLLNENLRRHAVPLCEHVVPAALASDDRNRVLATLRTLAAWERAIPLGNLEDLLRSPDRAIRLEAIRLAPFVPVTAGNRAAIVAALADPDFKIGTAAAISATRLRLEEALPLLARLLRMAPAEVARTAAAGLAQMPPRGWETLEELSVNSNPVTAAAAREALARVQGRLVE